MASIIPSDAFKDKQAAVTGAGSGIGRAIALRLAAGGAAVAILEREQAAGEETRELITAGGGSARVIECDVSDADSVKRAFGAFERLDILVNNAGIAHVGTIEQTEPEDMDRLYAVNVKGVYLCMRAAMPLLTAGKGVIVNLASIASKLGLADRFAYSMSKGAVLTMTYSVAKDYVGQGVRCNCVCPARVHTPFVDGYLERNYPDNKQEMFEKLSQYQPVGRMGAPEEVAAVVAFLCSDDASFITGVACDVDGGVLNLR